MSACVRLCTCLYIYVRYLRYLFVWHFGVKLWACVWRVCMCVCVSIKLNETLCTNGRHIWFAVILFFDVAYLYVENTMICRRYGSHENWISMTTNYRSINGSHQFIEFKKKRKKNAFYANSTLLFYWFREQTTNGIVNAFQTIVKLMHTLATSATCTATDENFRSKQWKWIRQRAIALHYMLCSRTKTTEKKRKSINRKRVKEF